MALNPEQREVVIKKVRLLLSPDSKQSNEHLRDKAERLVNIADGLRERMLTRSEVSATEILAIALASVGADDRTHAAIPEIASDELDLRATVDLMGLVMIKHPTLAEVKHWSEDQVRAVDDWASSVHLSASDNDVPVPPKPPVIQRWEAAQEQQQKQ